MRSDREENLSQRIGSRQMKQDPIFCRRFEIATPRKCVREEKKKQTNNNELNIYSVEINIKKACVIAHMKNLHHHHHQFQRFFLSLKKHTPFFCELFLNASTL